MSNDPSHPISPFTRAICDGRIAAQEGTTNPPQQRAVAAGNESLAATATMGLGAAADGDAPLCPHGFDPRLIHCVACEDPALLTAAAAAPVGAGFAAFAGALNFPTYAELRRENKRLQRELEHDRARWNETVADAVQAEDQAQETNAKLNALMRKHAEFAHAARGCRSVIDPTHTHPRVLELIATIGGLEELKPALSDGQFNPLSYAELMRLAGDAEYALAHLSASATYPQTVLRAVVERLREAAAHAYESDFFHGVEELTRHWRENGTLLGAEGIVDFIIASTPGSRIAGEGQASPKGQDEPQSPREGDAR